jgi:hypothetical protein
MNYEPANACPPTTAVRRTTRRGAVVLLGVLTAVVTVALAAGDGSPSFHRAVAFTAAVCGGAALAGWFVSRWPCRSPATAVAASLAAVLVRLAAPLAALAWLQSGGEALRAAGADRLLVSFYLALLATDIVLNITWRQKLGGFRDAKRSN